jgi:hypothetical protein
MRRVTALAVLATLAAALTGCAGDGASTTPTTPSTAAAPATPAPAPSSAASPGTVAPTTVATTPPTVVAPFVSDTYRDPAHWICRPDLVDVCDDDLAVTDVAADGTFTVRPYVRATDPSVDCFYVYPTSSEDQTDASDLQPGREVAVTRVQVGRFSQVCNVYAPVYRSLTLAGLGRLLGGNGAEAGAAWVGAYDDVAEAWHHYLANDNHGRGVILISHSQGSFHLNRLLREVIDPDPAQRALLVGAYVMGGSIAVPDDAELGGDLQHIPLCRALDQTGCVVTYSTFDAASPPPPDALFGRPRFGGAVSGQVAGCVNPAAPAGGTAVLDSALSSEAWALADGTARFDTPFMNLPGLVTAECVVRDGFSYLEVTVHPDPADPRADTLGGVRLSAQWGMHAVDVQIAGGSLVEMARRQIAAYTSG